MQCEVAPCLSANFHSAFYAIATAKMKMHASRALCGALLASGGIAQKNGWSLQLLNSSAAPQAVCLDGTAGGYWIAPGNPSYIIMHIQGASPF